MRKIKLLILGVAVAAVLSGCGYNQTYVDKQPDGRLSVVYNDGYYIIVKDNYTGVQYISRANCGTCIMVDKDGRPIIDATD